VIEFLCPNGHRIRCQASQAGRAAKCPRCGVKFRVPDPAEPHVSPAVGSDSGVSQPEFTDSNRKLPSIGPTLGGSKPREFEFLCPNGHRLHGSVDLQGKPGQCPECGSRFRIPSYEDVSGEEAAAADISIGRIDDSAGSDLSQAPSDLHGAPPHPMAALFNRLWRLRSEGATVELRLRDGEAIVPYQFLEKLSRHSRQGVFAVKEPDGSLAIVVVAWDAVARAALRGLGELPGDWAE